MAKYLLLTVLVLVIAACGLVAKGPTGKAQELCGGAWLRSPDPDGTEPYWEPEPPCPGPEVTATLEPTSTYTSMPTPTLTHTSVPTATATQVVSAPTATPTLTPRPRPTRNPNARTWIVPDDAPTIAQAVNLSGPDDTIRVRTGVYPPVVLNKQGLTLTTIDGPVVIDGGCVEEWGVGAGADDVTIAHLIIQNLVVGGVGVGSGHARMAVINNTIQDYNCQDRGEQFHAGVAAWYAGSGHQIIGNRITRRVNIPGLQMGAGNGIWFKSNSTDFPSGGGHVITDNIITGGYDGIGGENEDDPRGSFDRDTVIARNTITYCGDDGIQSEGGNVNVWITDNVVRECGSAIAIAPNLIGPLYIERNYLESNTPGISYGVLSCFKVGNGGAGTAYITDNYCRVGPGGDGYKQTNFGNSVTIARGNTFITGRYTVELSSAVAPGTSFDYNCHETSDPTRLINWGGARYDTLAKFQAAAGQELNGRGAPCTLVPTPTAIPTPTAAPTPPPTATSTASPTATPTVTPGGPMATLLQDDFTGSNGTALTSSAMEVGPGWSAINTGWSIQGNKARPAANTENVMNIADAGDADGEFTLSVDVPNTNDYALGFAPRTTNSTDFWFVTVQRDAGGTPYLLIGHHDTGGYTTHATQSLTANPTGTTVTLTMTLNGTTITLAIGAESVQYTSATFNQSVTTHGLYAYTAFGYAAGDVDNFLMTDGAGGGAQTISPTSVASTLAFGTAKLNPTIYPAAKASGLAFGTLKLNPTIYPASRGSTLAFGTAKLNPTIYPNTRGSSLVIGTPSLVSGDTVAPDSVLSGLAFGTVKLNPVIYPTSRVSSLQIGTVSLLAIIYPGTRTSTLSVGQPGMSLVISPTSRVSSLAFGTVRLNLTIYPSTRGSSLTFGTLAIYDPSNILVLEPPFTVVTAEALLTITTPSLERSVTTPVVVRSVFTPPQG